jgi:dipeptidyl-peptidase 4
LKPNRYIKGLVIYGIRQIIEYYLSKWMSQMAKIVAANDKDVSLPKRHLMKVRILLIAVLSAVTSISTAQDKKNFTMQEAILGYDLYPSGLKQLQWVDDENFSHVVDQDGNSVILINQIEETHNGVVKTVTREDIENALLATGFDSLKRIPRHSWLNSEEFKFIHDTNSIRYHIGNKTASRIGDFKSKQWQHIKTSKATQSVAFAKDNNLFVSYNNEEHQITNDGGNGIVYGEAVHRSEFGITEGLFWAPNGGKLAFYRMDETMVTDYPIYDLTSKPATMRNIKYPVAGDPSHHVTIGIYNVVNKQTIYLQTGEPKEQYLTNIGWGPEEKYVYVAVVNREQNHMWFKKFDAETGALVKTLFEEENDRYVEPEHPPVFLKNQPNTFVWWSERDGFNHLYLYNTEGELLRQLTKGDFVVTDFHGFSVDEKKLYITATKESPLNRDLYCVSVGSGKIKRLSNGEGRHRMAPNPSNNFFIDYFSNTITPLDIRIIGENGSLFETLKEVDNPLAKYNLGELTIGTIKSKDDVDLYYRLFKPVDFDPAKKYPVIVYLYGGPHLQLITNTWMGGANHWYQYLAQQGYIVFSIDNRGSANRGFEFESVVHRNMGTLEMEDQIAGINWLKSHPWVDGNRMGIHGWSYGGFMTTSLMTRHPGIFKAGVAGGPVINWKYYEVMYTERYMDTPGENPKGYEANNLLNHAENLEGKLLMIHGGEDNVVLWQHSLMYMQKTIESGVTGLDYFVYPNHEHNVRGKDRLHLYQKVTDYLFENLK